MGVAIVLNNANYASNNLGQVTFVQDVALVSLSLSNVSIGKDDTSVNMSSYLTYNPQNTNERGITWSIVSDLSGGNATINSSTGVLTVSEFRAGGTITVKATSSENPLIEATGTVTVAANVDFWETYDLIKGYYKLGDNNSGLGLVGTGVAYKSLNAIIPLSDFTQIQVLSETIKVFFCNNNQLENVTAAIGQTAYSCTSGNTYNLNDILTERGGDATTYPYFTFTVTRDRSTDISDVVASDVCKVI